MARDIALEGFITCWPIVLEECRLDFQAVMISFASSTFAELAEQYNKWGSYLLPSTQASIDTRLSRS